MNKLSIVGLVCLLVILSTAGCIQNEPAKKLKCNILVYWNQATDEYSYILNFSEKVNHKNVKLKIIENETGITETILPNENLYANSSLKPLAYHHYTLTVFVGTKPISSRSIEPVIDFVPEINYTASYNYSSKKIEGNVTHILDGEMKHIQNGNVLTKRFFGNGTWKEYLVSSVIKHSYLSQAGWKNITYTNGVEITNESSVYANGYMYSEQGSIQTNMSVYNVGCSSNGSWNYLYINSTGWLKNGNLSVNVTLTREYLGNAIQRNWLGIPYDCVVVRDTTEMVGYFIEGTADNTTYKDYFSKNVTKRYIVSSLSFENSTIYYEYNFTETYDNLTTNKTGTYFPKNSPTLKPIGIEDIANFRAIRPRIFIPGDKVIITSSANSSIFLSLEYSSSEERIVNLNGNSQKILCIKVTGNISKTETQDKLGSCSYIIASSHLPGLLIESREKITYLGNEIESTHLLRDIVL